MVHVIVILLDIFLIGVIVFDTYILEVCSLVNVWILDFNTYILVKVISEWTLISCDSFLVDRRFFSNLFQKKKKTKKTLQERVSERGWFQISTRFSFLFFACKPLSPECKQAYKYSSSLPTLTISACHSSFSLSKED